jgi:integrase
MASRTLQRDLAAAGIPFQVENLGQFDFHSLRAQYTTRLARSGLPVAIVQKLARHSDPRLTLNIYTKLNEGELNQSMQSVADAYAKERKCADEAG